MKKPIELSARDMDRVRQASVILSENLDKHITIRQLACLVSLPEKKLKAGFKIEFNTGVGGFQGKCRMEKIKTMLLSNDPIKAIAAATGYHDEQALITAFRKKNNITPAQWRKNQQHKSDEQ